MHSPCAVSLSPGSTGMHQCHQPQADVHAVPRFTWAVENQQDRLCKAVDFTLFSWIAYLKIISSIAFTLASFNRHILLWRYSGRVFVQIVWVVTWLSVVVLNVDLGLAIGVVFSMMTVICRTQRCVSVSLVQIWTLQSSQGTYHIFSSNGNWESHTHLRQGEKESDGF